MSQISVIAITYAVIIGVLIGITQLFSRFILGRYQKLLPLILSGVTALIVLVVFSSIGFWAYFVSRDSVPFALLTALVQISSIFIGFLLIFKYFFRNKNNEKLTRNQALKITSGIYGSFIAINVVIFLIKQGTS